MALYCAFTLLFASCVPTRQFNYFIIQDAILGFLGPIFLQTLWKNILVLEEGRKEENILVLEEGRRKKTSLFLPAFQSVYCYGKTFLKGGNKSCLLEGSQNPSVAALIERQQSPLTTGGAVTGPTLRATEPSMANSVCSPLQLGMDTPLLR